MTNTVHVVLLGTDHLPLFGCSGLTAVGVEGPRAAWPLFEELLLNFGRVGPFQLENPDAVEPDTKEMNQWSGSGSRRRGRRRVDGVEP